MALFWRPKLEQLDGLEDHLIRLWVELESPEGDAKLRLEASGRLTPALQVNLPRGRLDFGRLDAADLKGLGKETALELFTRDERHKGFAVAAESSSPGLKLEAPQALAPDRLAALKAVSGWRLTLRAGIGLPAGLFRERLTLRTPLYAEPLELPVEGQVESGSVSLAPERFEVATARLSVRHGYRTPPVKVVLRYETDRSLEVRGVEPPIFRAKAQRLRENEWSVELSLLSEAELRANLPPERLEELLTVGFDGGWVTCSTNHSQAPELRIPLSSGRLKE